MRLKSVEQEPQSPGALQQAPFGGSSMDILCRISIVPTDGAIKTDPSSQVDIVLRDARRVVTLCLGAPARFRNHSVDDSSGQPIFFCQWVANSENRLGIFGQELYYGPTLFTDCQRGSTRGDEKSQMAIETLICWSRTEYLGAYIPKTTLVIAENLFT
ncbi:hypothetical protein H072_4252 [Dactylellina haptotyla CBS 200.50]|uniref:Uncharacterized protein n=1 Tax=Dactylellina haptotyla (strain CBS 200.50) TaxID=1284197 RepID=S8C2D5_DACHA|nr:hypothetical protein H072_4252 [Dactylellina haptotyla CBS 200.50]